MSHLISCRQRAFILCVSSHDISGRSDFKKVSSHIPQAKGFSPVCILLITFTECSLTHPSGKCLFSLVYLIVMFQNVSLHITSYRQRASLLCVSSPVSSHILHTNCFSAVCIFSWHFKMSRHTSRRQMDFLLCVSSHDVSGCLWRHPAGKELFSCVSLLVIFQNVSWYIREANGFSSVCIFSWCFRIFRHTFCRQRAFFLCVSSPDFSKYLVAHPAGIGILSFMYLLMMFQNVLSHFLQTKGFYHVYLCMTFLIGKGLVPHPPSPVYILSSHDVYRMSLDTSCRQRAFLPCVPSRDVSECLVAHHILQVKGFSPMCIPA